MIYYRIMNKVYFVKMVHNVFLVFFDKMDLLYKNKQLILIKLYGH